MSTTIRFRAAGFDVSRRPGASLLFFVLLLLVWEAACRAGLVSDLFLPAPSQVGRTLVTLLVSGSLLTDIATSLARIAIGWGIGVTAGLAVGFAMGIWSVARAIGLPVTAALFPIPKIAILPLLILWLGIGEASKIVTIALAVFFPTCIATYAALDTVPRNLIRMAQSYGVPWGGIVRKVLLPGAMPGVLSGIRIGISIALLVLVSAEMIGAEHGIGAFMLTAGNLMRSDQLLAGVVVLSLLGLTLGTLLSHLERRLLSWR